jgi:hypothetical protein
MCNEMFGLECRPVGESMWIFKYHKVMQCSDGKYSFIFSFLPTEFFKFFVSGLMLSMCFDFLCTLFSA